MTHKEIRKKFLEFFERNGHKIAPSSSLLPKDDSSVLLTTAGMQQFKPYYMETESPFGNRVASIQKCFRTSDIEEVGDERHLSFFEMLGNFSFMYPSGEGSYFKKEAIKLGYEFITKEMGLIIDYVTVFSGDNEIPRDEESVKIWKTLGMTEEKIKFFGREDNFWGPTGNEGPCGPTTEIYVNGIEIWNIVFNEYYFNGKNYEKLKYQGIDTGMGLERLAMAIQKTATIFETDLFIPIMSLIYPALKPSESEMRRIIADHTRAIVFLVSDGVEPSNKEAGYVLRRLMRRIITYQYLKNIGSSPQKIFEKVVEHYKDFPDYKNLNLHLVNEIFEVEYEKFMKTLSVGLKEFFKEYPEMKVSVHERGKPYELHNIKSVNNVFYYYQTYGLPIDVIKDLARQGGHFVDESKFNTEFKQHQEISRAGAENKFGGHGVKSENTGTGSTNTDKITKLHTATHLLQAALRKVLGDEIHQMGSDINEERLRFDFSFGRKLTEDEIKKVENLVNEKIKDGLEVKKEEMKYEDALKSGALAFFKEKYPEIVTVYSVGNFSKEICGGPHIANTAELGKFKIIKEESSSAGVRRIKAAL